MVFDWPVVFAGSGQFHEDFSLFLFLQSSDSYLKLDMFCVFDSLFVIGVDVSKIQDG